MELGLVGPPVPPRRPHPGQCSLEDIGPTQTMRQFASEVMGSREAATGFHTPRSSGAGPPGFDEHGYPVSPGGTVIRPPPGPPPLSETVADRRSRPAWDRVFRAGLWGFGCWGCGRNRT